MKTLRGLNSTLSGNSADTQPCKIQCGAQGGGIFNSGTLIVNDSTLSGNHSFAGGGIDNRGRATIQNTIITNNGRNNSLGAVTSQGYNLSSDGSCNFNGSGDLNNTDPGSVLYRTTAGRHRLSPYFQAVQRLTQATRMAAPMVTVIC